MEGWTVARVLHVLGVVLWIGGVAMVTTVLLPAAKRMKTPAKRVVFFETVERGFALQARVTTLVTGLSGLYLASELEYVVVDPAPGKGKHRVSSQSLLCRQRRQAGREQDFRASRGLCYPCISVRNLAEGRNRNDCSHAYQQGSDYHPKASAGTSKAQPRG